MLLRPNCNQILKSKNAVIFVFFVETTQKSPQHPSNSNLNDELYVVQCKKWVN